MIDIPIKQYDPIIAILRSHLLVNADIANFIGKWQDDGGNECTAIYPAYMDSVENPVFPAITICMEHSKTLKGMPFDGDIYYIHGWSKVSPDEAAYLYNLVVSTLDADEDNICKVPEFIECIKTNGKNPLYDSETQTHYFMTEFAITASKDLINA